MATQSVKPVPASVRCAIYTRKSTEEGLEQTFNSLDAQREAAEAYIASQKAEGWYALAQSYEDGGFSGGNMERPGLAKLLAEVEAGRIDCVVVYKVDRLSRSLLDFARIMAIFEKRQVSFVSVTQQFNTSMPVGRLTLNILFSFAQFEREIISERTRDKHAAARRKGKWTGGFIPLGYDLAVRGGALVVNEMEAEQVRSIYRTFVETGSFEATLDWLKERGWKTKTWKTANGRRRSGSPFRHASLWRLLTNEVYLGMVRCQGTLYRGEQAEIVEPRLWKKVNEMLRRCPPERPRKERNKHGALLKGILYCGGCGGAMAATYTTRREQRYRYYVCARRECRNRVAAQTIEHCVVQNLRAVAGRRPDVRQFVEAYEHRDPDSGSVIGDLRNVLAQVSYDNETGKVTMRLSRRKAGNAKIRR